MRKHPYSRTPKQTITFNEETPRLIEGNLPLLPSEQESTLCRGIRKPIGELATQTDALRYPGTHEALQPAHLLPCPQGRKAVSPSEQQVVLNALKRCGVKEPKDFDAYFEEYD